MFHTKSKETPSIGDFVVIAMRPAFIAFLVGSLVFFLLDVFYQGKNEGGIRWMMFWYVVAIVAVARISVDRGQLIANVYGLALAVTTWLYISSMYQGFMLGIILLAFIWWCAHRLVTDCSALEKSDKDMTSPHSNGGILGSYMPRSFSRNKTSNSKKNKKNGIWVVYFSIAAVPLFGIGKALLPESEGHIRSMAGIWLVIYLVSAFVLLISTRFLNLRQSLRKRRKKMPSLMAVQWFYSGICLILIVGFVAWLTPRPGSTQQWAGVLNSVNLKINEASQWAMQWNSEGSGEGFEKNQADQMGDSQARGMEGDEGDEGNQGQKNPQESGPEGQANASKQDRASTNQQSPNPLSSISESIQWLQWLFWIAVLCVIVWMLYKNRALLTTLFKEWWAAFQQWLKQFGSRNSKQKQIQSTKVYKGKPQPCFKDFKNPFIHSKMQAWGDMEIIHYTMDAFQAWLLDHHTKPLPSDTPVEQLQQWQHQYPDAYDVLHFLYSHHTHAGFGRSLRSDFNKKPLEDLWNWLQRT
ncbi:MAG: hypothetical protein HOH33_10080 [Verrucomicrobia bacterium]|jgi:hypothetical protein|nr:hypothetical protein [Verrucomicrobiota bacterium]